MIIFSILLSLVTTGEVNQGITADVWSVAPYDTPSYDPFPAKPLVLRVVYEGETYDELGYRMFLPAMTAFVVRCDPAALTLADTLAPDYGLTPNAQLAIEAAPAWLRLDLVDNLMQLGADDQNTLADMILNPSDPRLRDEIAFQAAHISPPHLQSMNLSVITQNLDSLFAIDEELDYVEIVDYGNPDTDDDYYSTARYKALDNGSYVDVEIPYEIYYWYVIMPRITDELPKIIYEKFWREFLYYDNGTTSYTENPEGDPYPLLRDVLADIQFVWDGERHVWAADREHSTDMGAINAIGWWTSRVLPSRYTGGPRFIQPNNLATCHYGNCGECQDLFCAALRTGMIPALGVMDINEDHVWNAFWWPYDYAFPDQGGWYPCQVDLGGGVTHAADSGCAYDKDRGGGKYCSMIWNWRTDGYQYSSITTYSNCCTLTVAVYDTAGRPVSNADVKLQSRGWKTIAKYRGYSGITNRDGIYTTTLGEEQDYDLTPAWEYLGWVIDSASALAGTHFFVPCTLSSNYNPQSRDLDDILKHTHFSIEGELDTTISLLPDEVCYLVFFNNHADMGEVISGMLSFLGSDLRLEVNAEYDLGHCPTYSYEEVDSKSAVKFAPGQLTDFFITDYEGIYALGVTERVPVSEQPLSLEAMLHSKDGSSIFKISGCRESFTLIIFDKLGRRIYKTRATPDPSGNAVIVWHGADHLGRSLPCGVYFVRVESGNQNVTRKFVMLR